MIAVVDYGAGNLFSVQNALKYIGEDFIVTNDIHEIERADSYILPGVGAFPFAMEMLYKTGLTDLLKEQVEKKPLLGICLGMQMLFEQSTEVRPCDGLGLIKGKIEPIPDCGFKIPHMGWSALTIQDTQNPLLNGVKSGDCVYFVHSFMAMNMPTAALSATANYGIPIPALVSNQNVYGAQFHPEKSGETGLIILKNFGGLTR